MFAHLVYERYLAFWRDNVVDHLQPISNSTCSIKLRSRAVNKARSGTAQASST
jgi:hypothetical protein